MNYDLIAHVYDEPERRHGLDPHLLPFLEGRNDKGPVRVLDLACGTGQQLAANRGRFPDLCMAGVDRFREMLRIARRRCPGVIWVQGDAESLPLRAQSFDYITNQFAYPHIRRTDLFVREVARVLRPGGRFVMTNIDPWSMKRWLVYQFFPQALELDLREFVPLERLIKLLASNGLRVSDLLREDLAKEQKLRDFRTFAGSRHRASQLMAISDSAYAAGMRRLDQSLHALPDTSVLSEFVLVTIVADKPSRASRREGKSR